MASRKINNKLTKKVEPIDEEESKLFNSEKKEAPKTVGPISKTLTVNQFMDDLKVRFAEQMTDTTHVLVYFFPEYVDEKKYNSNKSVNGNKSSWDKTFVNLQPEMITLVNKEATDPKLMYKSLARSTYEVYRVHGIKFETHVKIRYYGEKTHRYETMKDDKGNDVHKKDKELKEGKVNFLSIMAKAQSFDASKESDFAKKILTYYKFAVYAESDKSMTYKYLMNKRYNDAEPFEAPESDSTEINQDTEAHLAYNPEAADA